jgi:hypothetical protein
VGSGEWGVGKEGERGKGKGERGILGYFVEWIRGGRIGEISSAFSRVHSRTSSINTLSPFAFPPSPKFKRENWGNFLGFF